MPEQLNTRQRAIRTTVIVAVFVLYGLHRLHTLHTTGVADLSPPGALFLHAFIMLVSFAYGWRAGIFISAGCIGLHSYLVMQEEAEMLYPELLRMSFNASLVFSALVAGWVGNMNRELQASIEAKDVAEKLLQEKCVELEHLARIDPLTGLYNRRHLYDVAHQNMELTSRKSTPFGIILLDLDRFKDVNDRFGHGVGDEILKAVAARLKQVPRKSDVAARFGGEEFILILPDSDKEAALNLAERLRAEIESIRVECEGGPARVTASFGVSIVRSKSDGIDRMIGKADKAVYAAKDYGRNQVVMG